MKNYITLLLLIVSSFVGIKNSKASHVGGGNFTYTCIDPTTNTYQVTFTFWRDCSGTIAPSSLSLSVLSNCGSVTSPTMTQTSSSGVEVSQLCPTQLPSSSCQNGFLQGYQQYSYTTTVSLNPACNSWQISTGISARNPATNMSGSTYAYYYGTINNTNGVCNNSPTFNSQPIPYYCTGQQVNFNPGVQEIDGDSLVFSLVQPQTSATGLANYSFGYSSTNPFGTNVPVTFDPQTGQLSFIPLNVGNFVVAYQVCEYRNGVNIGCVMREFQIVVQNCNNQTPYMPVGMENFNGNGTIIDSNSLESCVGDSFSFQVFFYDSLLNSQLLGDSITITTNAAAVLPGANVTITHGNPAVLTVDWITSPNSPQFNYFIVELEDDACPVPGLAIYQFDITINPATYAGPDLVICGLGDTNYVYPTGGDTFFWSLLSGDPIIPNVTMSDTTGTNGDTVWFVNQVTSTYIVESNLQSNICKTRDTITLNLNQVDVGPDTVLCEGDTMTMGMFIANDPPCDSANVQYSWSPTTGLSDPNIKNPLLTVQLNQTTTMYTLSYFNGCSCTTVDSFLVNVSDNSPPSGISNKYLCGVDDGEFTVIPQNGFSPYEYSIDSGLTFQASNFFDSLPTGFYNLVTRDSLGCVSDPTPDTIFDFQSPYLDSINVTDVVCYGAQDGTIEAFFSAGATPFEFSIDSAVTFQNSSLFTNLDSGSYWVSVRDANGCETFPEEVNIGTNNNLLVDSINTHNLVCYNDTNGYIHVYAHGGTPPLLYSIDNGATYSYSYLFNSIPAGQYVVIVQDVQGCTTPPQVFNITQPNRIDVALDISNDTCFEACGGEVSAIVNGGVLPYNYNWYGHGANGTTSFNLCAGSYQFRATDASGCFTDTTYVIEQPDELLFDSIPFNNSSCYGANDGSIRPYMSGGTAPYMYSIDGGQTFTPNPEFTGLQPGTYEIVVYDSGYRCMNATVLTLVEPSPVVLESAYTTRQICLTNCTNMSVSASGGNVGPYTYHWDSVNATSATVTVCPKQDTVYSVYATDINGCISNTENIEITLYDSLRVSVSEGSSICPGDVAEMSAYPSGGNPATGYSFRWNPLNGVSDPYNATTQVSPNVTTQYVVELTDGCGTPSDFDTVTIVVHPLPEIEFEALTPITGCEPLEVSLENLTDPTQYANWTVGNQFTGGGNTITVDNLMEGSYDVSLHVVAPTGCESDTTIENYIIVNPLPEAIFTMNPNPTTIFTPQVMFTDQSFGNIVSYQWDFAGIGNSNDQNPIYKFPSDTGLFPVYLTVTTDSGCVDTTSRVLRIGPEFNFYIPNTFTPDENGLNDLFKPEGIGVDLEHYNFKIFDRWGSLVFETNDFNEGWDGNLDGGQMANLEIYVWIISVSPEGSSLEEYTYTGKVNLIR